MPRFVALLRGVNVGGKNKVAMSELRVLAESLGLEDVSTLIQSGNLVFTSGSRPSPEKLTAAIAQRFGVSISVAVRSASELRRVLSNQPFGSAATSSVHVGFLTLLTLFSSHSPK